MKTIEEINRQIEICKKVVRGTAPENSKDVARRKKAALEQELAELEEQNKPKIVEKPKIEPAYSSGGRFFPNTEHAFRIISVSETEKGVKYLVEKDNGLRVVVESTIDKWLEEIPLLTHKTKTETKPTTKNNNNVVVEVSTATVPFVAVETKNDRNEVVISTSDKPSINMHDKTGKKMTIKDLKPHESPKIRVKGDNLPATITKGGKTKANTPTAEKVKGGSNISKVKFKPKTKTKGKGKGKVSTKIEFSESPMWLKIIRRFVSLANKPRTQTALRGLLDSLQGACNAKLGNITPHVRDLKAIQNLLVSNINNNLNKSKIIIAVDSAFLLRLKNILSQYKVSNKAEKPKKTVAELSGTQKKK